MSIKSTLGFCFSAAVLAAGCATTPKEPSAATACVDPRPEICTMEYLPVCGVLADGSTSTYANACSACGVVEVQRHSEGACD